MATREDYTNCMKPFMTGGGPERKERFCVGAKICSGKAANEEEAAKLCAEAAANPKPPKEKRGRKVCTLKDLNAISICLTQNIDLSTLTPENMHETFSNALKECTQVATAAKVSKAAQVLEALDPEQLKALETIALLSQQAEGRKW